MTLSTYPATLDTDANLYQTTNLSQSTLMVNMGSGDNTITVITTAGFPSSGLLRVDIADTGTPEFVSYSSKNGTQFLGVVRGIDSNYPAISHLAGVIVAEEIQAWHHNAHTDAIKAIEAAMGTNPQGSSASIGARILAVETAAATGGFSWLSVTTTPTTAVKGTTHVCDLASGQQVFNLPTTPAFGDTYRFVGRSASSFRVNMAPGFVCHFGNIDTSAGGNVISTNRYDIITISCIRVGSEYSAYDSQGDFSVA